MISTDKVTEIFFEIDEFCKVFEPTFTQRILEDGKKHRKRAFKMSMSEILTYNGHLSAQWPSDLQTLLSVLRTKAYGGRVSQYGLIQSVYRAHAGQYAVVGTFHEDLLSWEMHRDILCGFHSCKGVQE